MIVLLEVLLEWIGSALQIAGALWLALNLASSAYAFLPMLVGSIVWMAIANKEKRYSLFAMQVTFAVINIVGIARWLG
jgi:intracellular septation protein A